jgi:hypothetical protein
MAAALLLHAVNPGLAAVGRFRGRCKLQSGNIIPFCNSQHKYSRVSLHGFANGARPGPPAGQESSKNTGRSARVTIEIAVFFAGLPRIAAWSVPQAMGRPATLSIMHFGKRPPSIGRRDRAPGGSDLVGPTGRPARSMEPAANLTWLLMLICRSRAALGHKKGGLGRDNGGVCASIW